MSDIGVLCNVNRVSQSVVCTRGDPSLTSGVKSALALVVDDRPDSLGIAPLGVSPGLELPPCCGGFLSKLIMSKKDDAATLAAYNPK